MKTVKTIGLALIMLPFIAAPALAHKKLAKQT